MGYSLRRHLTQTFQARGIDINIMEKLVGYELRCASPIPFDAEYTRDLGFGAMNAILTGQESGMVCRHMGRVVVFPFDHFKDPRTKTTRIRFVDVNTESFLVSTRYQLRLRRHHLEDPAERRRLAVAAKLSEDELVARFEPLLAMDR